jgi:surface polysaccharide O-acyltransferase-like enzyme
MPTSLPFEAGAISSVLQSKPKFVPYTDALRVAGALAVVFIHVSGDGAAAIAKHPTTTWWFCLSVEALSRWAVPIFVMVSGLLLLDPGKEETPGKFYMKRLHRLAIPMVFWSLFYLAWRWFYEGERTDPQSTLCSGVGHFNVWAALYQVISGSADYHLWFMTMLIGLYLCTPLLRVVVRGLTPRQLWITTIVILALAMADAVDRANFDSDFTFLFKFCPFIGLFFLGYCLRGVHRGKKMVWIGAAAWIAGSLISVLSTYFLVYHCATGSWDADNRLFLETEEFAPGPLISSIGVFTMVAAWYESSGKELAGKWIQTLSGASLGIYLAHPLFLSLLYTNDIEYNWHGVFVGAPLMIVTGFIGAMLLTLIFQRIPYLRKVV